MNLGEFVDAKLNGHFEEYDVKKDPMFIVLFGAQSAREGRQAEARQALNVLEGLRRVQYVEPFLVLELCAELKDAKRFSLWFKRMDEERSTLFVYWPMLKNFYRFDPAFLARGQEMR